MLQDSISLLRRQYLGLNRILSTFSELIHQTVGCANEQAVLEDGLNLLLEKHNFQFCSAFSAEDTGVGLLQAKSINGLLRDQQDESTAPWVADHHALAREHLNDGSVNFIEREQDDGGFIYSAVMRYEQTMLGCLVVTAPSLDENHGKFLPIFATALGCLIVNKRSQAILAEDVKRRSLELESAWQMADLSVKAKNQFLSNVSHEYLTPLNQINSASTLLLESQLTPEQAQAVTTILSATKDLNGKIDEALDFSNEPDLAAQPPQPTHIEDFIASIGSQYERHHDPCISLTCAPLPDVELPQDTVGQILVRLLDNAFKFTDHGSVELSVDLIAAEGRTATVEFRVTDTGIGISTADQHKIFQAFHQVESSATRPYQGTGLGLALCQKLARSLGSEIQVKSSPGEGSSFSFQLRLTVLDGPVLKTKLNNQPDNTPGVSLAVDADRYRQVDLSGGLSVLLVEDNVINQKLAAKLLENMGCDVDIASDGVVAVDKFSSSKYDVVFMDCQMPNMDGFEATTRIRALESSGRTPIIALTANSLPEDRARSFNAGMDEFLTKPIAKEKLQQALQKWSSASAN